MNWWIARLHERSSWAALFAVLSLVGMNLDPELRDRLIEALIAVAAVVAFMFREKDAEKPDERPELPPIDLVGVPTTDRDDLPAGRIINGATRLQPAVPARVPAKLDSRDTGWNG